MTRPALALVAGVLLACGAPAGWLLTRDAPPAPYGAGVAAALSAPVTPPVAALSAPVTPPVAVPSAPITPPVAVLPAPVAPPGPPLQTAVLREVVPQVGAPVRLTVAGRDVPVEPVGVDRRGQVEVPDDVRTAGWYAAGARPGDATGSAVLVGHVDDAEQGLGTFAVLRRLQPGAEVRVRTATGQELAYDVVSLEQFDKAEVPMDRLFARDGAPRLVLVSCAGDFAHGRYRDNIVVTAVPRA